MTIKIKPVGDRILVEILEKKEKTRSGIIIPESSSNDGTHMGKVIAVGEGRKGKDGKTIKMNFKVGQKVAFSFGERIDLGDSKKYQIVTEASVLGIFD